MSSPDIEECIHGMAHGCTICSGRDAADKHRSRSEESVLSPPFRARYGGTCRSCGFPILVGDLIVLRGTEPRVALHEGCVG